MGDMADMITEDLGYDETGGDYPVTCKYCNNGPYFWDQTDDGKWRLFTPTGKIHKCSKYDAARAGGSHA